MWGMKSSICRFSSVVPWRCNEYLIICSNATLSGENSVLPRIYANLPEANARSIGHSRCLNAQGIYYPRIEGGLALMGRSYRQGLEQLKTIKKERKKKPIIQDSMRPARIHTCQTIRIVPSGTVEYWQPYGERRTAHQNGRSGALIYARIKAL
jgi:hypothetical protein